jgi:beta-fructofuranosidase
MLDYGFDFYAPQVTQAPDGRIIMIGWADMWGSEFAENVDGWSGMMTLPRELHIKKGKVISKPVKELEKLRTDEKSYKNVKVTERTALDGISGETGELLTTIDTSKADGFFIELRSAEEEKTVISYDKASGILKLNRNQSGVGVNGEREVKIDGNKVDLQIFLDRSSVEIFINGGDYVMTSRIYPKAESQGIFFEPINGMINLKKVSFYKLAEGIPQPVIK